MFKRVALFVVSVLVLLSVTACGSPQATPIKGASMTGATMQHEQAGEYRPFTVRVDKPGDPIGIDVRGTVTRGSLRAELVDVNGHPVWQEMVGQGAFHMNTIVRPEAAGDYLLGLAWDGPMAANISLRWQPGAIARADVTPTALLSGLGMCLVAIVAVIYAATRRLGWGYLGLGALAWVVAVALKFAWAVPVNPGVYAALEHALPAAAVLPVDYVYVGLLTGVFEVALVWLALRYTRLGRVTWGKALAFGIGFGAVEALLLGFSSLASTTLALLAPTSFQPEQLAAVARLANPLYGAGPVVERVAVVLVHIACNVLLFYAVRRKQAGYLWLSFALKTLLDTVGAYGQVQGVETLAKLWIIEGAIAAFGVVSYLVIRWLAPRYQLVDEAPAETTVVAPGAQA